MNRPLVAPVANPVLERALREKLERRSGTMGHLGELATLAVQLGLVQNSLKPGFEAPQVALFAADHGLAVEGLGGSAHRSTTQQVRALLSLQLPLPIFAELHGLALSIVDCGLAEAAPAHPRLLARKIAHATHSSRHGAAMSQDQLHSALRAGMEIAALLPGNAIACAGLGVGSTESAALVVSRLSGLQIDQLVGLERRAAGTEAGRLLAVLHAALLRHREVVEPLSVLAAFGGFEIAVMVGVMLTAASERRLILVDGIPACAALMVASSMAPAVTDYCLHCRSHGGPGLDAILRLFQATALLELGIETLDGTGAALAWPLIKSAAALMTEVADAPAPPT